MNSVNSMNVMPGLSMAEGVSRGLDEASTFKSCNDVTPDQPSLAAVLQFLKKHNFKEAEFALRKQAKLDDNETEELFRANDSLVPKTEPADMSSALASCYKCEGDPSLYEDHYESMKIFIDQALDAHKCELSCVFYPVFVHMYLELVYNNHEDLAKTFFDKFRDKQEDYYQDDITRLGMVTKSEHMKDNQLMESYKSSQFTIRMSRDSYNHLKRFLVDKRLNMLLNIVQDHLFIDVFDGVPRSKQHIDATSGFLLGDAKREVNKAKVYYGLLKEPEMTIPLDYDPDDQDQNEEGKTANKRKKGNRKDQQLIKKSKNDPNAPLITRIPLPDIKDSEKEERRNAFKESARRVMVGPDHPPTICFHTFVDSMAGVTSVAICEDSSMLAAGFADHLIKVWSLTKDKLATMKSASALEVIDKDSDNMLREIMNHDPQDPFALAEVKVLHGHHGDVYAVSFSYDKAHLISCSEDATVRLWSLLTWTNIVCYKGHLYPVWDVKFSPYGHYFASVGLDRTARLWTLERPEPVRIFSGHYADVDCVEFHPNCNYIVTGSADKTVRMWDVLNGACVRIMTGHKATVHVLRFSPDGKFLASAGADHIILLWEISSGDLISQLTGHTANIYSLAFSREGAVLASGGLDNMVKMWDVARIFAELDTETVSTNTISDGRDFEFGSYRTKSTSVLAIHFTRRNLLLCAGPFVGVASTGSTSHPQPVNNA